MGEHSKIEWTDHTFNPWVGCTKVSPACDHCYAEGWAKRTGGAALWQGERRRTSAANWRQPIKWNRQAEAEGRRFRVFCASLADVFDNQAEPEWRADLFAMIRETHHLDWLLLTKRPQNICKMLPPDWGNGYPNVWIGTTVEYQQEADRRIPHLLAVPARVRFLSCEPLLGPVDLTKIDTWAFKDAERAGRTPALDWIIVGGESGPSARPMHPDWARSLRDQCAAAGVAFHFKQWGEWLPFGQSDFTVRRAYASEKGNLSNAKGKWWGKASFNDGASGPAIETIGPVETLIVSDRGQLVARLGKKAAGRLLDGIEHNGFPSPTGRAE